jgi:hypothetical protein
MRTVLSLLTLFYSVLLFAQTKVDVVYMLNGTEHRGHVAKVTATDIVFVHEEETIEYSYPRADIFKIVFASGRQELFNAQQASGDTGASMQASSSTTAPPGSVAILPFRFIADASPSPNEELA